MEVTLNAIPNQTDTKAKVEKYKYFTVSDEVDPNGCQYRMIRFTDQILTDLMHHFTDIESMYDDNPSADISEVSSFLDSFKTGAKQGRRYNKEQRDRLEVLITVLENENSANISRLKNLLEKGNITFSLVRSFFTPGTEIEIHGDELAGGKVIRSKYQRSFFGNYLEITYEYLTSDGESFIQQHGTVNIPAWKDAAAITDLSVRPMTSESKTALTARGLVYQGVAVGSNYQQYKGYMQVKKWWRWDNIRSDGRIMIDTSTYNQFVDNDYGHRDNTNTTPVKTIPEDSLWMTDPYVFGFSFVTKTWGRFCVSRVSNIAFRDDAFDRLVLGEDKKRLIKSLVVNGTNGFQDVISGKGGGCIFLLHGKPGVGKTLTAEAIAELLHRPLYSVSVGQLGSDPKELEENLRQILDVAQIWNAVILIDEADIFLEKRSSGDIVRNQLVSIFLRLLEYHQGVLFLTTNRVSDFDPAFYSRISIALKYGSLNREAREEIWNNLLDAAKVKNLDAHALSMSDLNGRQIKNIIRLAQGIAQQDNVPVSMDHIEQVLAISRQFEEDLSIED